MEFLKTEKHKGANAMGQDTTTFWHHYQIEPSDLGKVIPNWGGYAQPGHRISKADIGKTVIKYTETQTPDRCGWHCYTFG